MKHKEEWFNHILNSQWVSLGNNTLIQPKRASDGSWTLGDIHTNDQEILEACPLSDISTTQEFHIIHSSWKAALFKIYKPMIYFCAFGKSEIFECVYTSIQSLIEFGQWQHDIAIFTAEETKADLQTLLEPLELKDKLHIITVPVTEKLDWYMARYHIDAHPILQKAQPLLYLDTDIICDGPLDELFIRLIDTPFIHACKEGIIGEGSTESGGHWYGWRLMQDDQVPFHPQDRGFSSGAMFFNNVKTTLPFFKMITESVYGYMEKQGYQDEFYDQRFANYILFKFKKIEINIMENWIYLYRIPQDRTLTPSNNKKLGLVHFLNATTANKLITMKKYIEDLRFYKSHPN